jgi:hypothetical protein
MLDGMPDTLLLTRLLLPALLAALLGVPTDGALAQAKPPDELTKFISGMFDLHWGTTLCTAGEPSLPAIRAAVVEQLKTSNTPREAIDPDVIAVALWSRFPCPFSPYRPELRPAAAQDVEGAWLFPESSQRLRYGPRTPRSKSPAGRLPVKCEAVYYAPGGELKHAMIAGQPKCPFETTADLGALRDAPRIAGWSLLRDGRIGITPAGAAEPVEEWDVYAVVAPFTFEGVRFAAGDLVEYARKEKGNEVGAVSQFRHLQRLN